MCFLSVCLSEKSWNFWRCQLTVLVVWFICPYLFKFVLLWPTSFYSNVLFVLYFYPNSFLFHWEDHLKKFNSQCNYILDIILHIIFQTKNKMKSMCLKKSYCVYNTPYCVLLIILASIKMPFYCYVINYY